MREAEHRALAALIAGAVLIGLAPIFVRLVDVGYTAAAFWRTALALPVLAGLMAAQRAPGPWWRPGLWGLLLAGAFFAADLAVWHQSIRLTSVANATLMANLTPIFVTLASFLLFGERFRKTFLTGVLLSLAGAALLMWDSLQVSHSSVSGDLVGILAAVFYSGYLICVSRARQAFSAAEVMFWTTLATAVCLLPLTLALGEPFWPQSLRGWAVLAGLALLSHVAGQGLIAFSMAQLPASFSAVGLLVQPVAAAGFAWWLLAEPFGPRQALGGAIVLGGILLCRQAMLRGPRRA